MDVKVPLSKISNFQNYRLNNKLLQELGEAIFIIISNTLLFNQKSVLLLNSSGRISSNWNFLPSLYRNPLLFIIYIVIKQGLNSWLLQVVTDHHIKIKFQTHCLHYYYNIMSHLKLQRMQDSSYWWNFLLGIVNISGILLHEIPEYTITNAICFDRRSTILWLSKAFKQYFDDWLVSFKEQDGKPEKKFIL